MDEMYETPVSFPFDGAVIELYGIEKVISINGTAMFVREGTWLEKDDNGEFYPDFTLTWFYPDANHPEDFMYFEGDSMDVAIHNFRRIFTRNRERVLSSAAA